MSDINDFSAKRRRHASTGNNPVLLALGNRIRQKRLDSGLTQEELALVSGVGRELVIQLENGKSGVTLGKASHVMSALGLRLAVEER
ncbi:MAG: helix-turn-helix domain-containing protein [Thiolinea sp.]